MESNDPWDTLARRGALQTLWAMSTIVKSNANKHIATIRNIRNSSLHLKWKSVGPRGTQRITWDWNPRELLFEKSNPMRLDHQSFFPCLLGPCQPKMQPNGIRLLTRPTGFRILRNVTECNSNILKCHRIVSKCFEIWPVGIRIFSNDTQWYSTFLEAPQLDFKIINATDGVRISPPHPTTPHPSPPLITQAQQHNNYSASNYPHQDMSSWRVYVGG